MRRRLEREDPERLKLRMWAFPWLTYLAIAGMVAVIGAMALVKDVRSQLLPSLISLVVVLAAAWWHGRRSARAEGLPGERATPDVLGSSAR